MCPVPLHQLLDVERLPFLRPENLQADALNARSHRSRTAVAYSPISVLSWDTVLGPYSMFTDWVSPFHLRIYTMDAMFAQHQDLKHTRRSRRGTFRPRAPMVAIYRSTAQRRRDKSHLDHINLSHRQIYGCNEMETEHVVPANPPPAWWMSKSL